MPNLIHLHLELPSALSLDFDFLVQLAQSSPQIEHFVLIRALHLIDGSVAGVSGTIFLHFAERLPKMKTYGLELDGRWESEPTFTRSFPMVEQIVVGYTWRFGCNRSRAMVSRILGREEEQKERNRAAPSTMSISPPEGQLGPLLQNAGQVPHPYGICTASRMTSPPLKVTLEWTRTDLRFPDT